jgi:hypothetical protein
MRGLLQKPPEIRADEPLATLDLQCKSLCITVGKTAPYLAFESGCEFPPVMFGHFPFRP